MHVKCNVGECDRRAIHEISSSQNKGVSYLACNMHLGIMRDSVVATLGGRITVALIVSALTTRGAEDWRTSGSPLMLCSGKVKENSNAAH